MLAMPVIMSNYTWPVCPRQEGIVVKIERSPEVDKIQKIKHHKNHGCPQLLAPNSTTRVPKVHKMTFLNSVPIFFLHFFFTRLIYFLRNKNKNKNHR